MSKLPTVDGIPIPPINLGSEDPPLDRMSDGKKLEKAKEITVSAPSRFSLRMSAGWWRSLQYIGMSLHFLASPRPPNPAFSRSVRSTVSKVKGHFDLQFYTPKGYKEAKKSGRTFPAVVNFHGGGFTIGNATDDARFARFVLETCQAVFVSVDYRLSPEHPFPVAVDDGADAILYVIQNAAELRIDPSKLATSGFSAGGNIAMTSALRFSEHVKSLARTSSSSSAAAVPDHRLRAIATWYPITDYTLSRAERRASSIRPDQTLPPTLTTLFDSSYLYPPDLKLNDPFLSPSKASDELLMEGIPPNVIFYTCEWDMLLREGDEFAKRLGEEPINKNVRYKMIPGVPHGWDKSPDPVKPAADSEKLYLECCEALKEIFAAE
ncbi:Alpha/Beta hydrolase protein [Lasiosphaeria ovina]|uniref:Alpha/Beta hydrolase protein n=1 Tax=Lasiosphaeria ovina TaxID=92902 RepID=A0AAE0MZL2_9PEZI|nr:Alpha/Beta hydrolase protein [Lasiosphaeria ovina]